MRRQDNFLLTLWLALTAAVASLRPGNPVLAPAPGYQPPTLPPLSALFVLVCLSRRLSIVREKTFATRNLLSCLAKVPRRSFLIAVHANHHEAGEKREQVKGEHGEVKKRRVQRVLLLVILGFYLFFLIWQLLICPNNRSNCDLPCLLPPLSRSLTSL